MLLVSVQEVVIGSSVPFSSLTSDLNMVKFHSTFEFPLRVNAVQVSISKTQNEKVNILFSSRTS